MKKFIWPFLFLFVTVFLSCKKDKPVTPPVTPPVTETPVLTGLIVPSKTFPSSDESFTLTFDPSKGNAGLSGYSGDVYIHAGVITNASNNDPSKWMYVKYDWTTNNAAAKMTRQTSGKYTIDINPRTFFNVPSGETILKLAMVFRNADGSLVGRNKDGSDIFLPLYAANTLNVRFSEPEMEPTFDPKPAISITTSGQELNVTAYASQAANLVLTLNGTTFANASSATKITGKTTTTGGLQTIKISANSGTAEASFSFITGGAVQTAELPAGAKQGVTFMNNGTSAIFALYAPQKSFVNVMGDFNGWIPNAASFMKRTPDENTWWIQIDGLDPNKEYTYQYLVDGVLKIADPYCEKVLDPWNDATIPAGNNSNFGTYPTGKTTGIVSWMKANDTKYNWINTTFNRPAKNNLVIYELLLRDFLKDNNYKTLTDTLNYFTSLGINAIELLPVNEFEGNSSWGYNPDFYFAPDKYYGSKYYLQRFIDECHTRGIAVIMDMVLNHSTGLSPMAQLYWDAANSRPAANSPWYNATSPHPLNFGPDFNHESLATKAFAKNVMKFWMQEYKIDGIRFDVSKGFTQTNSGSDMNKWGQYDQSRINIWKDYNNYMKSIDGNNFYVILEHFADASEEKVLAADGMMLWNNLNYNFNEATMGWISTSDFKWAMYNEHGFSTADGLITYMESHDEERNMYKNLTYGNTGVKANLSTSLLRTEAAAAFLFAIPGPKMIWQFGELGYDVSIDFNGRVGEKPLYWDYNSQPERLRLKNAFSKFINLKKKNPIFQSLNPIYNFGGSVKYLQLTDGINTVIVIGNFDVSNQAVSIPFDVSGTWYDAKYGSTNTPVSFVTNLAPGEYHIYSKNILTQ